MQIESIENSLSEIVIVSGETTSEINALCERSATIAGISSDAEARIAGSIVRDMKSLRKMIGNERKSITKVLDDAKKRIMKIESNAVAVLESEAERVGGLATAYLNQKKAEQEKRNNEIVAANTLLGENQSLETGKAVSGVRSRETWDFEVENPDDVPREFCEPSAKLIRQYIKSVRDNGSGFDSLSIRGIKFTKSTTVY